MIKKLISLVGLVALLAGSAEAASVSISNWFPIVVWPSSDGYVGTISNLYILTTVVPGVTQGTNYLIKDTDFIAYARTNFPFIAKSTSRRTTYLLVSDGGGALNGWGETLQSLASGTRTGQAPTATAPESVNNSSGAVSGNQFGWDGNGIFPYRTGRHIRWSAKIALNSTATSRTIFGVSTTGGGNMWAADNEASHQYVCFRFSTSASDVNFQVISRDNATTSTVNTGVAADTAWHTFELFFDDNNSQIVWKIDSTTGTTSAHLPQSGQNLMTVIGGATLTTSAASINLAWYQVESDL